MKRRILINENQYNFLFESDDFELKINTLINSGQLENIELAFQLIEGMNLDKEKFFSHFQETFDFLKHHDKISANPLDEMTPQSLYEILNLENLGFLQDKLIEGVPELWLPNLFTLYIELSDPKTLPKFSHTPKLNTLILSNNELDTIPFWDIQSLKFLSVANNNLSDVSVFKKLTNLTELDVSKNYFKHSQAIELQQMLPNTIIRF
jgi:Leucine-rich repeat (LRR) protein